jgi:segregation and condensation protein B
MAEQTRVTEGTAAEPSARLKIPTTLKALVEGMIFAAAEPLSVRDLRTIYEGDLRGAEARLLEPEEIRKIVDELNGEYRKAGRPYQIVTIAGGYQFATLPEYAGWLGKLYREQGRRKLSQSGVESLAIIAYKQPITKAEIEKIRGVNCDYVLKTLLEKELASITGRAETVGRPLLYGTTREFLKHFGLNDITDLPRPREIEEILGESQFETERRMLEAQAGADATRKETEDFKSRLPHIPKKKADLGKDVAIVDRKRTREINVVAAPLKPGVDTGQEQIVFEAPSRVESSGPNTEQGTGALLDAVSPAAPVAEVIHAAEPVPPREGGSVQPEGEVPGSADEPQDGPQTPGSPKKRWSKWKEKISGFIRKLFA